jgi:hypothetical protein
MGALAYREDARNLCSIFSELTYTTFTNKYCAFRFYYPLGRKLGVASVRLNDAALMEIAFAAAFDLPAQVGHREECQYSVIPWANSTTTLTGS